MIADGDSSQGLHQLQHGEAAAATLGALQCSLYYPNHECNVAYKHKEQFMYQHTAARNVTTQNHNYRKFNSLLHSSRAACMGVSRNLVSKTTVIENHQSFSGFGAPDAQKTLCDLSNVSDKS